MTCALPDHAKPRSIDINRAPSDASSARRRSKLGATRIGGAYGERPINATPSAALRGEHIHRPRLGLSAEHPARRNGGASAAEAGAQLEPAGAVVEARLVFRRWPRAGDLIEVHSGVAEVGDKTMRLVHWLLDPASGGAWASMEAVALTFDTVTRKAISPAPEARAAMSARVVKGLAV